MDVCALCGCTDEQACPGGCSWVAPGLCSRCADAVEADLLGPLDVELYEHVNVGRATPRR